MPMHTRDPFAIAFKSALPGKGVKQAPELPAGALLVLIAHAGRSDVGITSQFARLVTLVTVGCVRFKHQGRSKLIQADGAYLSMRCSMGKAKTGGVRRPFDWIVPRFLQQGIDTLGPLVPLFEKLASSNPAANFVVPKDGRTGISNESSEWDFSRGMSYSKFVDLV